MAAPFARPNRIKYTAVKVLMICWQDCGQKEFKKQLDDLSKEFTAYGFDVEPVYRIESKKSHQRLDLRLHEFLKYDKKDTLLIVYYGGHGQNNPDKNNIWLCHDPATVKYDTNPKVNWSALQGLFLDECESSVLFLLDCCFAASAVQSTHGNSVVEAIVAAGVDRVAPLQGSDSFTRFLRDTLKECRTKEETGIYSARLCSLVSAKLNQTDANFEKGTSRRVTPHHLVFSNQPSMIYLYPLSGKLAIERGEQPPPLPVSQQRTTPPIHCEPLAIEQDSVFARLSPYSELGVVRHSRASRDDIWATRSAPPSSVSPTHEFASIRALSPALSDRGASDHRDLKRRRLGGHEISQPPSDSPPYRSLDPGYMRVLHLQPSSNRSDAIYCSFTIHKVKACNSSYKAVSHVWYPKGISQERVTIQIADGDHIYPLEIRPNQERALRQIRHPSHKVCLWIDALCINQKDMEEKAHQNKMMPFIFQSASEVIVWLGDGDDDTEKAMKFIPQLIDLTDFDRLLKSEETPAQWQALVKLLENPYFSRRWVFLEVILARRAVVHCGAHSVLWDEFCDAVLLLGSRFEDIQFLCKRFALTQDTGNRLEELADLRALSAYSVAEASRDLFRPLSAGLTSSLCTLGTLVSFLPGLQTRDPRDVIWALLPVASDAVVTGIHMDFDMHASTLYQQFARYCADTTNTIDIICTPWAAKLKDSISFLQPYPPLPSWICSVDKLPFGRRKKDLYGRKNGDVLVGRPNRTFYNAAQNSIAVPVFGTTSELGHTILDGTMIVSGFQLGTISELGNRAAAGTLHSEWVDMSGWQPGDKVVPDMLWRTLVADRGPDGTRTPPWYHRACLYWLDAFEGEDVTYDVLQHKRHPSSAVQYMQRVQTVIWNRKLFVFANRSGVRVFGLAPQEAKLHDSIAILHGCSVPVILRQDEKGWRLIGECFVYGNMDGEAMKDEENKKHTQEFLLY